MCIGLATVCTPGHLTCFSLLPKSDWGHHYSLKILGQALVIVLLVDIVAMIFIHLQMAPNDIHEQQKNVTAKSLFL